MATKSTAVVPRRKVLLVDDDGISLELMAMLLAHEGHQVLRAHDAEGALNVLSSEKASPPDVLLVDMQMPGVSGGQLAERVRAMGGNEPLMLAMSASEVQRQQLMAFDGFLLKPLALEDFRRALRPKPRHRNQHSKVHRIRPAVSVSPTCENVDNTVIQKLLKMMPAESLATVVSASIADTRACIDHLRKGPMTHEEVRPYAHRMKGAAAMIGASRIAKLAANLEAGGYKEAATPALLDDLVDACDDLERILLAGKFTNTQGPPP